jgi:hypothetical protein
VSAARPAGRASASEPTGLGFGGGAPEETRVSVLGATPRCLPATPRLDEMRVEIGPVEASSARAWIAFAREVLAQRRAHDAETLPDDVRDGFEGYLAEWEAAARGEQLRWESEVDVELLEYLVHAFYRVATRLAEEAERRCSRASPPEGEAFYRCLVSGLLDALSSAGNGHASFADELRPFWPGYE